MIMGNTDSDLARTCTALAVIRLKVQVIDAAVAGSRSFSSELYCVCSNPLCVWTRIAIP